jgi:LPXTG-motif cell wall-anchored protein
MTEKEVQATLAKSGAAASTPAAAASPAPSTAPTAAAAAPSSSAAATSGAAPRKLPKTGSPLPVLGLAGLASLLAGLGLTLRRHRATH